MLSAPEVVSPAGDPGWATHIPGRRPQFKPHKTVGQAKNAVINVSRYGRNGFTEDMVIYNLDTSGKYVPWLKIAKGSFRNDYEVLAEKPLSLSQKQGELHRLERRLQYHQDESAKLIKEIAAYKLSMLQ